MFLVLYICMVKNKSNLRVSIVIPVYNEQANLRACLEAIENQTVTPHEVIVVDNNSTDNTCAIACEFPFVRLVSEKRQGVVYARAYGFDIANGDIIGRIDADTLIEDNWVETLQKIFLDQAVDAVSGSVHYYDVTAPKLSGKFDLFFRSRLAKRLGDEVFLYGANMAIRQKTWQEVRHTLCARSGLHEDFDLAIHAENGGAKVVFDKELHAGISLRRFEGGVKAFFPYAMLSMATYEEHGRSSQKSMLVIIIIVLATYRFIWLNHQIYNIKNKKVSWRHLFGMEPRGRVNPATYVE